MLRFAKPTYLPHDLFALNLTWNGAYHPFECKNSMNQLPNCSKLLIKLWAGMMELVIKFGETLNSSCSEYQGHPRAKQSTVTPIIPLHTGKLEDWEPGTVTEATTG